MEIWPFLTFLTWPWIESHFCSNEVKLQNNRDYRVLRPKWTMKHVSHDWFENFGFGDFFWPDDLMLNMKISLSQHLRLVLGGTYGKFWTKTAKFEFSMIRNLNTPKSVCYRRHFYTETALTEVTGNILLAMDQGDIALLVLIDFSCIENGPPRMDRLHICSFSSLARTVR